MSEEEIQEYTLRIEGMDCTACVTHIEGLFKKDPKVKSITVNIANNEARTVCDDVQAVIKSIIDAGFGCRKVEGDDILESADELMMKKSKQ